MMLCRNGKKVLPFPIERGLTRMMINAGRIPVVSSVAPNEDVATEVLNDVVNDVFHDRDASCAATHLLDAGHAKL